MEKSEKQLSEEECPFLPAINPQIWEKVKVRHVRDGVQLPLMFEDNN